MINLLIFNHVIILTFLGNTSANNKKLIQSKLKGFMKKNIMVIASAATEGGALEIIKQYLASIMNSEHTFYILVNSAIIQMLPVRENFTYINVDTKSWRKRLVFDLISIRKLSRNLNIDICVNFQNIPVRISAKQYLYLQQSIPFSNVKFSFFKRNERKLWLYKYVYFLLIKYNIHFASKVIVQTRWMKDSVVEKLSLSDDRVNVFRPSFSTIKEKKESQFSYEVPSDVHVIFYPAANFSYKNHKILIDALMLLDRDLINEMKLKLIFTIDRSTSQELYNKIKKYGLDEYVDFIGFVSRDVVDAIYRKASLLVFPSKVETFGMPLIEATLFNINIVASDLPYAHEVLEGYNNVRFCNVDNAEQWASAISTQLNKPSQISGNPRSFESDWEKLNKLIEGI